MHPARESHVLVACAGLLAGLCVVLLALPLDLPQDTSPPAPAPPRAAAAARSPVQLDAPVAPRVELPRPPEQAATLAHPVPPSTTLAVRVLDGTSGLPVERFRIAPLPVAPGQDLTARLADGSRTREVFATDGTCSLEGLGGVPFDLWVDARPAGLSTVLLEGIALPTEGALTVRVPRGPHVTGSLTDASGAAVTDVEVTLDGPLHDPAPTRRTASTDEAGTFLVGDLAPGTWRLEAAGVTRDVRVKPDDAARVDLVLATTARLTLDVLDDGGVPLPGASLVLAASGGRFRTATTDADGELELSAVEPGRWSLLVRSPGHLPHRANTLLVAGDEARMVARLAPAP